MRLRCHAPRHSTTPESRLQHDRQSPCPARSKQRRCGSSTRLCVLSPRRVSSFVGLEENVCQSQEVAVPFPNWPRGLRNPLQHALNGFELASCSFCGPRVTNGWRQSAIGAVHLETECSSFHDFNVSRVGGFTACEILNGNFDGMFSLLNRSALAERQRVGLCGNLLVPSLSFKLLHISNSRIW